MEILDDLRDEIRALRAEIQQIKQQVAKPPVVNIDTAKLATEVTRNLSDYTAAGEKVAGRIDAAVGRIPEAINNQYGINPPTRTLVIVVVLLILATGLTVFFSVPRLDADRLKSQDQSIKWYRHEVNYMRSKNPKTAANYDAEFRR